MYIFIKLLMILWFIYIYIYIYIILESIFIILESLLNSCTFVEGKFHRRDAYVKGEKTYFMRKPCSVCFTLCLFSCFSLWCFELLLVSILCFSHRIMFMCWACFHPYIIMLFSLHVRIIICFAM